MFWVYLGVTEWIFKKDHGALLRATIIIMHVWLRAAPVELHLLHTRSYCSGALLKANFIFIMHAQALREILGSNTLILVLATEPTHWSGEERERYSQSFHRHRAGGDQQSESSRREIPWLSPAQEEMTGERCRWHTGHWQWWRLQASLWSIMSQDRRTNPGMHTCICQAEWHRHNLEPEIAPWLKYTQNRYDPHRNRRPRMGKVVTKQRENDRTGAN